VTTLPWGCYLVRGALSTAAQLALVDRVGTLAGHAFEGWPTAAMGQNHPIIVASHAANAVRPRECRRACGLVKCMGHCGRHVGALYERPEDIFALARGVAQRIALHAPEVTADAHFDPTHFWSLVYGDTAGGCGDRARGGGETTRKHNASAAADATVGRRGKRSRHKGEIEDEAVPASVMGTTVPAGGAEPPRASVAGVAGVAGEGPLSGLENDNDGGKNRGDGDGDGDGDGVSNGDGDGDGVGDGVGMAAGGNTVRGGNNTNCGRMASHLDRPVGWTLSVSVGRPVRFNLGRPPESRGMYANYAAHKVGAAVLRALNATVPFRV